MEFSCGAGVSESGTSLVYRNASRTPSVSDKTHRVGHAVDADSSSLVADLCTRSGATDRQIGVPVGLAGQAARRPSAAGPGSR